MHVPHTKILILGLGSEALMDDGLPIRLIGDLKEMLHPLNYELKTTAIGGMELLDLIKGFKTAILIDTTKTPEGKPGTVFKYTPENLKDTYNLSSQHDVSFHDALKLGGVLNMGIPIRIVILAIEIFENRTLGSDLSEVIKIRYSKILSQIKHEIELIGE